MGPFFLMESFIEILYTYAEVKESVQRLCIGFGAVCIDGHCGNTVRGLLG